MRYINTPINIFTLLLFLGACTPAPPDLIKTQRIVLKSKGAGDQLLKITNTGAETRMFSLKVNDHLYSSTKEMLAAIKVMPSLEMEEPEHKKAWRFIIESIVHDKPLTEKGWQQSPMLLINSLGFGQCGHKAAALASLWEKLGYKSQVWDLGGHTVPEVYVGERWEMYDPDLETFYLNHEGQVAGVKEIENKPTLITNQNHVPYKHFSLYSELQRNTEYTSKLYATTEDNQLLNMEGSEDSLISLEFQIPAQGTLEFPASFEKHLEAFNQNDRTYFANAKLSIPTGWEGKIAIPLVIHAIRGSGNVEIEGMSYEIGSKELEDKLSLRINFDYHLSFSKSESPVYVIYFINPRMAELSEENIISFKGVNLSNLEVTLSSTPDSLQLNLCSVLSSSMLDEDIMSQISLPDSIKRREDLDGLIVQYVWKSPGLTMKEKEDLIKLLHQKLGNVLDRVDAKVLEEKILPMLTDQALLRLCLDFILNKPADEFMGLLCAFETQ